MLNSRPRLRLLSVGSVPPEWGGTRRGGVATFHATMLKELASRRYGVRCTGILVAPRDEIEPDLARRSGSPVSALHGFRDRKHAYRRALRRARPDVVVFNHVASRPVGTLVRLHRRIAPDVPAIGIAHSWHEITQTEGPRAEKELAQVRHAVAALDAITFGSHHCKREGEALGIEYPLLAEVIHYPLAHHYAARAGVRRTRRRGVVYVGSLIRRKNLASLVDAVAHRPSLDLTLAGEGPEEDALRRLADRLGAASRVRFVGHFPVGQHLDRMRELMRRAEVLCLPSHSESFGLVMTEALACGTPVVGFGPTLSEIEPLAGIDCGEAISTGTAEEIGLAIDRVLAHRWNRRRLRRAAVRAFHPRHTAHRYETLMRKLTSAKMAPA